jgi:glycerol-3-phosphate dehydrogenase
VAEYLSHAYGDRALRITKIAEERKLGKRLVRGHPVIEAEVIYCVREEYATTAVDFLAYRTRLAFLDTAACRQAAPRVIELMGKELGWGLWRKSAEMKKVEELLATMEGGS